MRIAIVDDHELVRDGLALSFSQMPNAEVVVKAAHGIDYERQVAEVGHVHVAVVDLYMPQRDGFETIAWICRHQPRTRALALSLDDAPATVQRALRAGACGYVVKAGSNSELRKAVLHVHSHGFYYNHLVDRELRKTLHQDLCAKHPDARWAALTATQRYVALAYANANGGTVADIAKRIGMHPDTFETHRKAIFKALGISSRAQLVQLKFENGWK